MRLLILATSIFLLAPTLSAAPVPPPSEALKRFRVADGFKVTLAASEPGIRQPVTISFDYRARLWVLQYLQYPNPAGLKAVSVDQYLRTRYDRVPEPPPRGPKGADKITICEDTDGDGTADRFKDFVTGLNLASGMALGYGGVFVAQPPYLLFYTDRNGDDVADGDPEVLLSGFGMEDSHAFANSLTWGPDGWLYGAHGSTVTANIRGIEFQQGIWRYHPITRAFELFAEGGGNTWGLDFDEEGEIIAGTNFGEQIGLHQVQGAYYVKGFAKHGPLHNPHSYGYFDHLPFKGFKGGHVTCGGIVYGGGLFPPDFKGTYIAANLLSSAVYWHNLETNGSSRKGSFGGPLLQSHDSNFRPIDCLTGPDGAVYVVDWCDPRASHVDPVDNWDKSNGRVYRLAPSNATGQTAGIDLTRLTGNELVAQLTQRNDWFRRSARQILAERRDTNLVARLSALARQETNALLSLESLWALHVTAGLSDTTAQRLLEHSNPAVRKWTVRLLGDRSSLSTDMAQHCRALAKSETSAQVRNQLACSARRLSAAQGLPIVRELIAHVDDVTDPQIPLLLWWAIEDKAIANPREVLGLLSSAADWDQPMIRTHLLERIARRYASETNRESRQAAAWLLTTAPAADHRNSVLRGFDKAWEGLRQPAHREEILRAFTHIWRKDDPLTVRVGLRLGLAEAEQEAMRRITNRAGPELERAVLAEGLGQANVASATPALASLLKEKPKLQLAAINALQNFPEDSVGSSLIAAYPQLSAEARTRTRTALASRPAWAQQLIAAVEGKRIPVGDISPELLRQMVRHDDAQLTAAIQRRWGRVQPQSSEEKTSAIHHLKLVLNPSGTTLRFRGDPVAGKALFAQACGNCHRLFGEGKTLGPDLTGSDRKNVDWLLSQIVDPSGFIRPEYVNHNVEMKDGRALTGLVAEQTANGITLVDSQGQRTLLRRAEIKEINPSEVSLMPEALLEPLSPQQVRDLFSYLQAAEAR